MNVPFDPIAIAAIAYYVMTRNPRLFLPFSSSFVWWHWSAGKSLLSIGNISEVHFQEWEVILKVCHLEIGWSLITVLDFSVIFNEVFWAVA